MIKALIRFSAENRFLVLLAAAVFVGYGVYTLNHIPVDAIPDLSDTQVIVYSRWDRSPDIIEDQVTYPIVTALLGAPNVKVVRGFSDFGFSYVYVIFKDGTDIYWARSRVLEYLIEDPAVAAGGREDRARPRRDRRRLGVPVRARGRLAERSRSPTCARCQDWNLRYRLQSVPGVAEVASLGGFVQQYQVTVDPNRLRAYDLAIMDVAEAIRQQQQRGGRPTARVLGQGVHGPRPRLRARDGGPREDRAQDRREGDAGAAAGRRPGRPGPGDPARRRRPRRPRRHRGRDRRHAPRRERPRGDPPRAGAPPRDRAIAPEGRAHRDDLRPLGADPALDRHAEARARARDRDRQPGDPRLPLAHPLGDRPDRHDPGVGAAGLHPDVLDGDLLQHHVAGRHRDLDRRARGRGDRGGRERLQEAGALDRRRTQGGFPRGAARGAAGGGPFGLLLAAGDRRRLPADLHARGPGGAALQAAGLDQEPGHGDRRRPRPHARPGAADAVRPDGLRALPAALRWPGSSTR